MKKGIIVSYLKGKDIKTDGDCLVRYMCFKVQITVNGKTEEFSSNGKYIVIPEDFEKW